MKWSPVCLLVGVIILSGCSFAQRSADIPDLAAVSSEAVSTSGGVGDDDLPERHARLVRLYFVAFGQSRGSEVAEYWTGTTDVACLSDLQLAEHLVESEEFSSRFGTQSDREFIDALFLNVSGGASRDATTQFWVDALESGVPRSLIVLVFSDFVDAGPPLELQVLDTPSTQCEELSDEAQPGISPADPPGDNGVLEESSPSSSSLPRARSVLIVGDSLVTGLNSYADEVELALRSEDPSSVVEVCGSPGVRVMEGWTLCSEQVKSHTGVVVFSLGTNDIVRGERSAAQGASELAAIVRETSQTTRVIVVLPAVFNEINSQAMETFGSVLLNETTALRLRFVDPRNHLGPELTTDGIHLRQQGAEAVANAVVVGIRS